MMAHEIGLNDAKGMAAVASEHLGKASAYIARALSYDPGLSSGVFHAHIQKAQNEIDFVQTRLESARSMVEDPRS